MQLDELSDAEKSFLAKLYHQDNALCALIDLLCSLELKSCAWASYPSYVSRYEFVERMSK